MDVYIFINIHILFSSVGFQYTDLQNCCSIENRKRKCYLSRLSPLAFRNTIPYVSLKAFPSFV